MVFRRRRDRSREAEQAGEPTATEVGGRAEDAEPEDADLDADLEADLDEADLDEADLDGGGPEGQPEAAEQAGAGEDAAGELADAEFVEAEFHRAESAGDPGTPPGRRRRGRGRRPAPVSDPAPVRAGRHELAGGTTGPWDVADAPDDEVPRLDLGGLRVGVAAGLEVRVDVNQDQEVVAATLVDGASSLQVSAFAAPRREGIWDEIRGEIAAAVRSSGGTAEEVAGPFGPELHAQAPQPGPTGVSTLAPARFVGVDGPRWFLRGLVAGPAATDPAQAGRLEEAFRTTVVVRGDEAMAPRDGLVLRLPREAFEADAAAAGNAAEDTGDPEGASGQPGRRGSDLDPFERGPEITEIY